jgi:hypothetical protein
MPFEALPALACARMRFDATVALRGWNQAARSCKAIEMRAAGKLTGVDEEVRG